jgi:hypothetical protein
MPKNRGKRPPGSRVVYDTPPLPADNNHEPPKFCLHFLRKDYDVHALNADGQAAFAKTLQKLSASHWKDLILAQRHGQGSEFIPRKQIKAPIPPQFEDKDKFLVFRYHGNRPMAGVRIGDIFHVLWIEPEFGRLYDHS